MSTLIFSYIVRTQTLGKRQRNHWTSMMRYEQSLASPHCLVMLSYWVTVKDHLPYYIRYCFISVALPNYHSEENREMIQRKQRDWVTSRQEQRSVETTFQTIHDKLKRRSRSKNQLLQLDVHVAMRKKIWQRNCKLVNAFVTQKSFGF